MGSPIFKKNHVKTDDIMVVRMRAAGAIIIGKTNTPEFGLGSHTFNPVHGATGNAYDATRSAGGSSGGAAVALATGMIRYADGSDMMGSLRNPAGWNNVYGMRPTWGLVPSEPLGDSFLHQLATNGPMARCPKDLATLLSVQSGPDARQPHGLPTADFAKDMDAHGLKGAQIAWLGDWGLPFDDGIMDISERAVEDLRALGADVTAIDAPFSMDALWESWITLRSWTVASGAGVFYDDPEKRDLLKPAAIWEIERGFAMSAREVHQQSVIRSMWFKKAAQLFETYDALLMPSAQVWPFPIDWVHPTEIAGVQMDTYHRWMQVVIPAGLIGLSVVNLPIGFGAAGLSAGLQLIGGRGQDAKLLGMANDWYHGTPWKDHTPA
jgi:amidase